MQADGRRAQLSDNSTAKFVATLDLSEPRLIEVEAFGPLAQVQGAHRAVSSQWVVPSRQTAGRLKEMQANFSPMVSGVARAAD
jgi:hypothetical protein